MIPSHVLKLERAEEHLATLDHQVRRYLNRKPGRVTLERQDDGVHYVARFHVVKFPPVEIGLMVGDFLANLRDSLDHLVYALTLKYAGVEMERSAWPTTFDPGNWSKRTKAGDISPSCGLWKIRGIDPAAAQHVYRLQPFFARDGAAKDALWQLDQLCNIDKHREIHLVVVAPRVVNYRFSPPAIVDQEVFESGPFGDNAAIGTFRVEGVVPDADVNVDAEIECQVLFQERSLAHGGQLTGPMIPTLEVMANYVRRWVFPRFESYL